MTELAGVQPEQFRDRYGPWALVAGASMGIGAAFSHEAASRGLNVVMLARGEEQLRAMAAEVRATHRVDVRTVVADLGTPNIADLVSDHIQDIEVGLVIYNAAVAPVGPFVELPIDVQIASIAVNCIAPLALCKMLAPKMLARGHGGIGMVSSMAATQGSVNFATYNAGKAFQWILAETLWAELSAGGVDVTNIFVGATSSPNYNAFKATLDPELCNRGCTQDPLDRARWRLMNPSRPEEVAVALYDQLAAGPVCYANGDDEWVSRTCLAMPRDRAVDVWRALQETSTRPPDRQAR